MKEKFYIATAIAYSSGKPHIGNTYEIILADAIARYKRLQGYDVYFQTGTDDHGQKIENKAIEAGKDPKEFVEEIRTEIKKIWDIVNSSYDKFVGTSNPDHKAIVQKIFKQLYNQGDIYKGKYEGLYCMPCESFFTETQLIDGNCPDCNAKVTVASEEAYFFKVSKYIDKLAKYIEDNPGFIRPESRKNEIVNNFIKPGVQDLCVSRTSFKWGVPVDFDDKHIVYVWIDALSNYITFLDYDPTKELSEEFKRFWPCDIHLIGKDILRFHTIYWPIILMALDLPLPKTIFGHPWLLSGKDKMSKSKGNILYADDLVNKYSVDAVRYYVLHETPFANDGVITEELIVERTNSDLANTLGNLVNRTITMAKKYFEGNISNKNISEEIDKELLTLSNNLEKEVTNFMDEYKIADALTKIFDVYRKCNKYIDETMPWALAKEEDKKDRLETVLFNLLDTIRQTTILLQAFLPETAKEIFYQLGIDNQSLEDKTKEIFYQLREPKVLFQRIEDK